MLDETGVIQGISSAGEGDFHLEVGFAGDVLEIMR